MSKVMGTLLLTVGLVGSAHATHPHSSAIHRVIDKDDPPTVQAPEMNPASAMSALTLLGGIGAIVRRRSNKS